MSDGILEKGVDDDLRELDAQVLGDYGFFGNETEIQNMGSSGSGFAALSLKTPALDLIAAEDELDKSLDERIVEAVREARLRTLDALLDELVGDGSRLDPVDIGATVLVWAWDLQRPGVGNMTQQQIADLTSQTRAAVCERHKRKVQRKKEAVGMKGDTQFATKTGRHYRYFSKFGEGKY